jgi:alpha-ribazole phosphatase
MRKAFETAAIVLAAGRSSRTSSFKPLLPLGNTTFVEETVKHFLEAGVEDVRVVTGFRSEEIAPVLDGLGVKHIFNEEYDRGMLSSVLAGVRSLESGTRAFFLLPVDIPLVKPGTIEALLKTYEECESTVIYPSFLGTRGHPPLIHLSCITEDLEPDHEGGLRAFLKRYENCARDVDVVDEGILLDCDLPEDYARINRLYKWRDIPTERECRAIWALHGTPRPVIEHSLVVAEAARLLAVHLNLKGRNLNTDLIVAAGLLHDLARKEPRHAAAGATVLRDLGYRHLAEIVAVHMDIPLQRSGLGEAELVYLADKYVDGSRIISMDERFPVSMRRYGGEPEIQEAIRRRWRHAGIVKDRIERILECSVESVFQRHMAGLKRIVAGQRGKVIYLIRHGLVAMNGGGRRYVGQLDLSLHEEGIRQAEELRERLKDLPISAVYCSDLKRSVETARIIARDRGLEPLALESLREINLGRWEGESFEEIRRRYPDAYEERGRDILHFKTPEGESFLDCIQRIIPALYEVLHSDHEVVLIVGHAGVNRIILCQALGWSADRLFEIKQDHGCLNIVHFEDSSFRVDVINGEAV